MGRSPSGARIRSIHLRIVKDSCLESKVAFDICIHLVWIMLDDDDNPIIIDFDNCWPDGQDLEGMGGTWPWADESTKTALPSNDLDALWDIREWLSDSSIKNFKFKEG